MSPAPLVGAPQKVRQGLNLGLGRAAGPEFASLVGTFVPGALSYGQVMTK